MSEEGKVHQTRVDSHSLTPLTKTVLVVRHECRLYFGPTFADKWGFFVDRNMSTEIHSYLDWVEYPKGDHVLEEGMGGLWCALITRDGCYLFSGSYDKCLIKWDLRTDELITRFEVSSMGVLSLAHTPGKVISGLFEGKITIWDDQDYSLIGTMEGHSKGVWSVSVNKQGTTLVSGSSDATCRVWSVKNGECLAVFKGHTEFVRRVQFADEVIISADQTLRMWDPQSGKELRKITDGIHTNIKDMSLNCDLSMIVCCHWGGLTLFKYPSMEVMNTVVMDTNRCCFHPSLPTILAVSDQTDYSIRIYRIDNSKQPIRTLKGHTIYLHCLVFSPDGYRLISVSNDGRIRMWDVSDLNQ